MDRHWKVVSVYVLRCQFRYIFREIQLFENARARLRWPPYSCAICDFCLHINPNLMMPWSLQHDKVFFCTFLFSVWPREQFYAGTSNFACLSQIRAYMSTYNQSTCFGGELTGFSATLYSLDTCDHTVPIACTSCSRSFKISQVAEFEGILLWMCGYTLVLQTNREFQNVSFCRGTVVHRCTGPGPSQKHPEGSL